MRRITAVDSKGVFHEARPAGAHCRSCHCRVALRADDPKGFALWKASELKQHDAELSKHMADDHSSRETLADYGDHRFRMLYRDADGNPEQHDAIIDIVMVQSGDGTLHDGRDDDRQARDEQRRMARHAARGGERHPLGPGDIVHIPAGIPHSFLVAPGGHITYVLLKIPTQVRPSGCFNSEFLDLNYRISFSRSGGRARIARAPFSTIGR